jgi:uncharacterized protein (DUF433 family)
MTYNSLHITKTTAAIGEGIFLAKDVADILQLPYHKVRYCMKGFWEHYTFGDDKNKAINFFSLLEFYIFYQLRNHGISSQKIKKVHTQMSKDLHTRYPFAHHKMRTDEKKRIWFEKFGHLIKADGKQQLDLEPILAGFVNRIVYGKNNIAEQYYPLENSNNIVIDPKHQFGQPTITGTNIKTQTIYSLHVAGEATETISNLYDISLIKVNDAVLFHKNAA